LTYSISLYFSSADEPKAQNHAFLGRRYQMVFGVSVSVHFSAIQKDIASAKKDIDPPKKTLHLQILLCFSSPDEPKAQKHVFLGRRYQMVFGALGFGSVFGIFGKSRS
jgi:hypothetical protein